MDKGSSFFRKAAGWLLGALGFGSCACLEIGNMACMYGCPHSDFTLDATVTDTDFNPIEGIKVRLSRPELPPQHCLDSAYTDSTGRVRIMVGAMLDESDTLNVTFEDVDGPAGGGEFETKTVSGTPTKVANGTDSWDMGDFEMTVNCELDRKL